MPFVLLQSTSPPTLQALAREVSARRGDLITVSPTSAGTPTTLVSTFLNQYFPADIGKTGPGVYLWGYGTATGPGAVEISNQGMEFRSFMWTAANSTLTFSTPGFPAAISTTTGVWELRRSKNRSRVVEAINSAVRQLDLFATREFKDETLTGVQEQWRYTLDSSEAWSRVNAVEVQRALNLPDYPYADARSIGLNWRAERTTDTFGTTLWQIQFEAQPPPGYTLRVWGEGFYTDLLQESDYLTLPAEWTGKGLEWIYDWALYRLDAEQAEAWAAGDAAKAMANRETNLQRAKEVLQEQAKAPKPGLINTPLSRVGRGFADNPAYLGAFTSGGIAGTPYNPAL